MSDHTSRKSDNEDDDLEQLRIAALKSLNVKKENVQSYRSPKRSEHRSPPESYATHGKQSGHEASNILTVLPQSYFPSGASRDRSMPHRMNPNVDSFVARQRLEQLDINEPYIPQHIPSNVPVIGQPAAIPQKSWMPEPAVVSSNYAPYIPHKVNDTITVGVNVQLSPRSMAFVAKNNDILMRRKGETLSPSYASYRSPSPPYRTVSPGRWSKSPSPPPKIGSRSPPPGHRLHRQHRRSLSRSPLPPNRLGRSPLPPGRQRSPRRRSNSRSPHPSQHNSRHPSPNPFHRFPSRSPPPALHPLQMRRGKSRSPLSLQSQQQLQQQHGMKHKQSPQRRPSRSPQNRRPMPRSSRSPPLNQRRSSPGSHMQRQSNRGGRRSPSPLHARRRSPNAGNGFNELGDPMQRTHSNRGGRSPQQHMNFAGHRRSMSPQLRQRSVSRSPPPHRRGMRRSRDRNPGGNQPARRRSPYAAAGRRRFDGPGSNAFRNRGRKRSLSPAQQRADRQRRSRSRSPARRFPEKRPRRMEQDSHNGRVSERHHDHRPRSPAVNSMELAAKAEERGKENSISPAENETKSREISEPEETQIVKPVEHVNPFKRRESTGSEDERDDEDDDENENDDDDDDDGIELFASEESESENEGRFKSSSKTERDTQAPTLSFTKLGETMPVEVKALNEMDPGKERDNSRMDRERNRNRDRGRDRMRDRGVRGGYRQSRDDRLRGTADGRRGGDDRRRNDNRRNRDADRGNGDRDNPRAAATTVGDERRGSDKPTFKPTFQALNNEGGSSRRSSRDRDSSDRRKRRQTSKDRKVSPEIEINQLPSSVSLVQSTINTTTNNNGSSNVTNSRIHSPQSRDSGSGGNSNSNEQAISGKKPIHLRLGAKTDTFKTAKKTSPSSWIPSSTTEKV